MEQASARALLHYAINHRAASHSGVIVQVIERVTTFRKALSFKKGKDDV
jgi:hypothetical protein